jgi:hypothetical protein
MGRQMDDVLQPAVLRTSVTHQYVSGVLLKFSSGRFILMLPDVKDLRRGIRLQIR